MDPMIGRALLGLQLAERMDSLRSQQFHMVATSQKVGDPQDLALRGAVMVQPRRVILREHLPMRERAPLQRRNIVANKGVHHVVGSKVVVVEALYPLYYGL
jgi:hypothetical protein